MENIILDEEKCAEKLKSFIFDIRKFFQENPDVFEKYKDFLQKDEELIF